MINKVKQAFKQAYLSILSGFFLFFTSMVFLSTHGVAHGKQNASEASWVLGIPE